MFFRCVSIAAIAGAALFAAEEEVTIPTIDLQEYYDPLKKEEIVAVVRKALHEFGFFAVKNTGIDPLLIQDTFDVAKGFFDLDTETKMKIDGMKTGCQRGYVGYAKETAKGTSIGDHKEYLHIGRAFTQERAAELKVWENMWPEEYDLETGMLRYLDYLERYMVEMQHLLAAALNVEEKFFDPMTERGDCLLRVIHYLAPKLRQDERMVWATAHTDIDLFTILPQATAKGLELQMNDGSWKQVNAEEGSFIINAGDFLEAYSNGYFKSAKHRVMSPEGNAWGERYSMVYFVHIGADDEIFPLRSWIDETGGTPKFARATRHEMLFERLCDLSQANPFMMEMIRDHQLMERLMKFDRASVDAMRYLRKHGYASEAVLEHLNKIEAEGEKGI